MKIYLINLDKNPERLQSVDARLRKLGVAYERIAGVLGTALTREDLHKKINRFRMWCAVGYPMEPGQIGCALSQIKVFRRMIQDGADVCCVLEDDVTPDFRFPEQLKRVSDWVDVSRPQVVLLTNYGKEHHDDWKILPTKGDTSAEAFVITAKAVRNILRANFPVAVPADWWKYWRKHGLIELYHAYPTVFGHEWMEDPNYRSDVCTLCQRPKGFGVLMWKVKRMVGRLLDFVFPL